MFARAVKNIYGYRLGWIPALVTLVALTGCSPSTAESPASFVSSPGAFKDDFDVKLASNGNRLWLAKTGLTGTNETRTQVLEFDGDAWSPLPGLPRSTTDTGLVMVAHKFGKKTAPCVGFSAPRRTFRIRCFQGSWRELGIPSKWRHAYLESLTNRNGKLFALFQRNLPGPKGTSILQLAVLKKGRFRTLGPAKRIKMGVLADIVESTRGTRPGPIEVGITSSITPSDRWILTYRRKTWSSSPALPRSVGGTMMTGPVRSGNSTFFPVNETDFNDGRDYTFSVFRESGSSPWSKVNGEPLNQGFGHAQGEVYPVGRKVWAIWSELDTSNSEIGGWFPTKTYAAPIEADGANLGPITTLWSGRLIFPASNQVVQYRGEQAFSYMRQFERHGGMHATVKITAADGG